MEAGRAMKREINLIVIHCSASPNGDGLNRGGLTPDQVIDRWHKQRGFHRSVVAKLAQNPTLDAIGYHFVIGTDGTVFTGRGLDEIGAHAQGHNAKSVGVCMVGTDSFTPQQWTALAETVRMLRDLYPSARLCGHRDLSPDLDGDGKVESSEWTKTCPGFDVAAWVAGGLAPLAGHLTGGM